MKMTKKMLVFSISLMAIFCLTQFTFTADASNKLNLKLQTHLIPADTDRVLKAYVEAVEALSGGQIKIKLFSGSTLVPMKDVLEGTGKGVIDMAMIAEGYWHKLIPVSEIAGMPFSFKNISEAKDFMVNRGFGDLLKEGYAKFNVYHIPYETYPVGLMTNKPINTVEDFKGMKLRAYGVMAEWLTEMGASTTYIPGGELYTALATGVVDGCHWGDAGPMYIMKFHEVLKNYMIPEPIMGAWNNLIVNMDLWKKLTPVQQKILEVSAMAMGSSLSTDNTRVLAETSLSKMVSDWNVKVNVVSDSEIEKMKAAAGVVWDKIAAKDPVNAKAIGMMKDYLKELGYIK